MEFRTITPAEMKRIETAAIGAGACTGEALMQCAAAAVARVAEPYYRRSPGAVAAVCGTGNNGGDAMAALRMLHSQLPRLKSFCLLPEGELTPDARRELERLRECAGAVIITVGEDYPGHDWFQQGHLVDPALPGAIDLCCVIDGLFGTGLSRPVTGTAAALCQCLNHSHEYLPVVAVDIPSGLCGRTGQVLGVAVHAAETVTFHRPKPGLFLGQGLAYAGKVTVADIGLPRAYDDAEGADIWPFSLVQRYLPVYRRTDHKGDHGRVVLLCGSPGMAGAAALAATAALRTGAGLVTVACPERILDTVQQLCPCATCLPLSPDGEEAWEQLLPLLSAADVLGMGCGLGKSRWAAGLVRLTLEWLSGSQCPAVIDADALNLLAGMDNVGFDLSRCVITPHPGEAARLLGVTTEQLCGDAAEAAKQLRLRYSVGGVVLKGAATVIDTTEGSALNLIGTPAMGKGGSGDVLTGLLCALLGLRSHGGMEAPWLYRYPEMDPQTELRRLLQIGCGLHGYAGCAAALEQGERGVLATDLCRYLGMERCERQSPFQQREGNEARLYEQTEQLLGYDSGQPFGEEDWRLDAPIPPSCWPEEERFDPSGWENAPGGEVANGSPKGGWLKRKLRSFFRGVPEESVAYTHQGCDPSWRDYLGSFDPFPQDEPEEPSFPDAFAGEELRQALLRRVTVTVEHQPGDRDAQDPSIIYTLNHGHVQQALEEENRWQDAYLYGESEPHEVFEGIVVAAFRRPKTGKAVWIVARNAMPLSEAQVRAAVEPMEKERPSRVECL